MTDHGDRARDGLDQRPGADPHERGPAGSLCAEDAEELTRRLNGVLACSGLASHPYGGLYAAVRTSQAHPRAEAATALYNQLCPDPLTLRSHDGLCALLPGVQWIGPGLVQASAWSPERTKPLTVDPAVWVYGGAGVLAQPSPGAAPGEG